MQILDHESCCLIREQGLKIGRMGCVQIMDLIGKQAKKVMNEHLIPWICSARVYEFWAKTELMYANLGYISLPYIYPPLMCPYNERNTQIGIAKEYVRKFGGEVRWGYPPGIWHKSVSRPSCSNNQKARVRVGRGKHVGNTTIEFASSNSNTMRPKVRSLIIVSFRKQAMIPHR